VKYGAVVLLAGAPIYLASDRGYFAEEGIDFEFVPFDSGALAIAPTAAGQLEIAQAPLGPAFFNVLSRGVPLTAIAALTYSDATLIVRKDWMDSGQVKSVADLRGKRVSLNVEGSAVDYTLRRTFLHEGVRLDEIEIQRLANSDLAPALANGAVDAGGVSDPLPIERAGLAVRLVKGRDVIGPTTAAVMAAGPSMLAKGEGTIVRFMKGYLKGMRDYEAVLQPDGRITDPAAVEIMSRWTHIAPDTVVQTTLSEQVPNGAIDLDDLDNIQSYWVSDGAVSTPVNLSQFVDSHFAAAARAQLP
jgi:NitT/TauT family transport system substrate-binding protein